MYVCMYVCINCLCSFFLKGVILTSQMFFFCTQILIGLFVIPVRHT